MNDMSYWRANVLELTYNSFGNTPNTIDETEPAQ